MSKKSESGFKILVAIASWGTNNDRYLSQLVKEYRSTPFDVDIVVLSNIKKHVAPGVELIVGLPFKNPWSLPFPHKQIFADRLNDYDLFIYSEDDTLVTEKNIRAFLRVTEILPKDKIPGFIRFERTRNGGISYPDLHGQFHFESESVEVIGEYCFAPLSNLHSACYLITREQLRRAIASGGYLVEPHDGKYDLLCTAATDPYTQCGFQKVMCVSHLDDFQVHHLPNRYVAMSHVDGPEMQRQVEALLRIGREGHRPAPLFQPESKLTGAMYSKNLYEPVRPEIASAIPACARSVLSVGCGWGAMEAHLAAQGLQVVAVPVDAVIPGAAEAVGVEIVRGDFATARKKLEGRRFDCLLLSNVIHLLEDPVKILASFAELLSPRAVAIIVAPNTLHIKVAYDVAKKAASYGHKSISLACKAMYKDKTFKRLKDFRATGVHNLSYKKVEAWCSIAGLKLESTIHILPRRTKARVASGLTLGLLDHVMASEIIAVAIRADLGDS